MSIKFNEPYIAGKELEYIKQVFENGFFAGNGPFTEKVQNLLAEKYQVKKVLLTHSCTAALEMSAILLRVGPGDEVILPSYTFPTTASSFLRTGAKLVFVDVDPLTMMMDSRDVENKITVNTKVIVPVHYGGIACDMENIMRIASKYDIHVVEDAAQGLDSSLNNQWLGTIGTFGCISFHETKNIHAGLAGALFINDESFYDRAVAVWERGTNRQQVLKGLADKYSWVELGSSNYPSELQAAFLLAQIESIDENVAYRKEIYTAYFQALSPMQDLGYFSLPLIKGNRKLNYHSFFMMFNSESECDRIREHLKAQEIMAYIGYVPLHSSAMGLSLGYTNEDLPVTERMSKNVLRLPFHNNMTLEDVAKVCDGIKECFK